MRRLILNLFIILTISVPGNSSFLSASDSIIASLKAELCITPMEALDYIKERYATNFEKVFVDYSMDEYYYELPTADYYLVYEGNTGDDKTYLFHLYEFVVDNLETGIGHMVTYGWYTMNSENGKITVKE